MPDPTAPLVNAQASRYFTRWTQADAARPALVAEAAARAMDRAFFARRLQADLDTGLALNAAMRRLRNLVVCTLIERDLAGRADLGEVVATMTEFADFAVQTHLAALMREQTALYGVPMGEESGRQQQMIVLGMGKLGGGELNVSSDIDLIFVYPEDGDTRAEDGQKQLSNHEFFVRLGKKLIGALAEITEDGFTFRVDMALRPNGNSGPLVASFNMVEEYLVRQGREWERYAWTKARALTGDPQDIAALEAISRPFIFRRYLDFGSIDALRSMHAQIRAEVKRQEALHPDRSNNVKLGRGGIREIEFVSQVFQLIRGGRDPELRDRSTRVTLRTLAAKNLLAPEVVEQLLAAYAFLRDLEHRLQYLEDAQTHTLPVNPDDLLLVARMMGYPDSAALLQALEAHRRIVAAQFDAIFNDKQAAPDNESETPGINDTDGLEAIADALTLVGFPAADIEAGAKRLQLTWQSPRMQSLPEQSRNRLNTVINAALPLVAALHYDQLPTLGRLLDFLEAIARRAAYLALLTEYPHALTRLIRMIGASGWAATYLIQHPILLDELLDDRNLKADSDWAAFADNCQRQLDTAPGDTERQMDILRELHHTELFRLLAQDLEGDLSVEKLADELSALADILVAATIKAAWQTIAQRHREVPQFAVIAYGKLGGKELGYVSDLDVVFLYDDDDQEAPALYAKLAQRFITWMTSHTPAGTLFDIDIALRPDGASGLLVSPVSSFEKYQLNSAWIWEHQALTRARFCAGDAAIGERFEALRERVLRQPRDYQKLEEEVLSMRRRMRDAHPNRSTQFDLKHDEGGMIDIEFIVQYLVLRHAPEHPQLTGDIGNIALLKLAAQLGLIDTALAAEAANAYRLFRKLQHQIRLQGAERAHIDAERVEHERACVIRLWQLVFG
ncbi:MULTISPECIES: bifunctional [glutamate--ammonia ligase]-adenylyl-L-tyrosine phosphorylase/[glutamate--ammonia-ligase] adenylyltransferase [unclassified Herbaspirillum]|uniref:bifunctional [glutamate--ammonia ligase]-adenylyl-L-tyrosine phosphorylase/[glutamate--ammonia-ligase] adenylyltransferase n=1 Tax=unclassified Herbaspirillum TaxID=2624150 RepID=UPI00114E5DB7|nr:MULTISPECIES: bifunctional [glutamate--ammonia ligase]-adenylyl-L-tyrosine phosphorylase/[glutamate--ammonia-ligase] adenylyltransferase [unclassified Herbaspirillum]MBB5391799.1 glutamate-ammonia-ligase adenylyltransferase [Herbaspirillum sp. SJZ102]TQK02957.1 glutamate-ammonia-ligase adenylyltransferase [Herbaspirillum sp. SJZ130]TQK06655.1 glutamate-ammonia-ligase adenylyltransferase [Herbaspirillum sp. SJZ106]TWC71172.1 glutamate-ammonia-ligase adenylyltransferase [Herbaspirillum sp. SJZ